MFGLYHVYMYDYWTVKKFSRTENLKLVIQGLSFQLQAINSITEYQLSDRHTLHTSLYAFVVHTET